jgi:hypothetical protein
MRFAVATCLTLATALVEALPSTLPVDVSNVSYQSSEREHQSKTNAMLHSLMSSNRWTTLSDPEALETSCTTLSTNNPPQLHRKPHLQRQ